MKALFIIAALFFTVSSYAQTRPEEAVLKLSSDLFKWEVDGKMDSIASLFDDRLIIVNSGGAVLSKTDYLTNLKKGEPIHNSIDVQGSSAKISGKTAVVTGKGKFNVTSAGVRATRIIAYTEIFILKNEGWKLIVLHASVVSN